MAIEETVSTKGSNKVKISVGAGHGVIDGKPYSVYGPAYLKVDIDAIDSPNYCGYRLWLGQEELPAGIDSDEVAMATAKMLFAHQVVAAENLNVIEMVREYGKGEYVADLRNTSWWIKD